MGSTTQYNFIFKLAIVAIHVPRSSSMLTKRHPWCTVCHRNKLNSSLHGLFEMTLPQESGIHNSTFHATFCYFSNLIIFVIAATHFSQQRQNSSGVSKQPTSEQVEGNQRWVPFETSQIYRWLIGRIVICHFSYSVSITSLPSAALFCRLHF